MLAHLLALTPKQKLFADYYIELRPADPRLEAEGFKVRRLEIDCRPEPVHLLALRCIAAPFRR